MTDGLALASEDDTGAPSPSLSTDKSPYQYYIWHCLTDENLSRGKCGASSAPALDHTHALTNSGKTDSWDSEREMIWRNSIV